MDLSGIAPVSAGGAGSDLYNSGYTYLLGSLPGSLVLFGEGAISSSAEPGIVRPELPSYRITTDGEELAAYGEFPGVEVIQPGGFPLPLGARTYATTLDDALIVSTAESPEFRVFGPDGALRRIVRWPDQDRTVDGDFLSRWTGFVQAQPEMAGLVEGLPKADRFPAHAEMIPGDDGTVWISEYPGPLGIWPIRRADDAPDALRSVDRVPTRRWLGFGPDGGVASSLATPEGFEPYVVHEGLVWGVFTDELDVESVRAYRLENVDAS